MTPEEFTRRLPPLTNNPLPIKPPFVFNGMSARVFPLRASLSALQQLCDQYLNFVPPETGRFRASVPYVYLMVLDYGQVGEARARVGWFSQVEVFFSVLVDWYKLVNGKWVFHDWAVITPYIFVDDSFSVPLGRTVYGFHKILAKVTATPSRWMKDPLAPVTVARVETGVFSEAYAGRKLETRVFLEVERQPHTANLRAPFDSSSSMAPWTIVSNLAQAAAGFGRDAQWMAQAMRVFPTNPGIHPSFLPEMLARMAPTLYPGGPGFVLNSLNLKQFRRADNPTRACYQSLTNGRMITTGFNAGGVLGDERILLGDLSGGYTIKLHAESSLPIVSTLGIEVTRQVRSDAGTVSEITPVVPLWMNIDLRYERGDNLAWRAQDGIWKDGGGVPIGHDQTPVADGNGPEFNGAVSSAVEAIAGPFQFSGTTVRVLPLLAKKEKLQTFLEEYVNRVLEAPIVRKDGTPVDDKFRLSVWSRPKARVNAGDEIGGDFAYVYMTVSSFADVKSKTNNVGDWAKYELSFMIPVAWERRVNGTWQTEGVGVVPAVTLVDDCLAAISRFEVQGIEARTATFVRPESVWLSEEESGLNPQERLLRVDAEVWPAFGVGQQATVQPLIQISRGGDDSGLNEDDTDGPAFEWAEALRLELGTKKGTKVRHPAECKVARALALELLGNRTPIAQYTLKQFRDVADPVKACFQSLVRVPRVFTEVFDVSEIEDTLVVRIHDYPSLNIVETLGILTPTNEHTGQGLVYCAQAIRPFLIRATVDEPLAEVLMQRAGTAPWTLAPAALHSMLSDAAGAPSITADGRAERWQDQGDPSRMHAVMYQARERAGRTDTDTITKAQARKALALVDPQMVIDSMLSREWGNRSEDARWRRGRLEVLKEFVAMNTTSPEEAELAELVTCKMVTDRMKARPGWPKALSDLTSLVDQLQLFSSKQHVMEGRFNEMAKWSIQRLAASHNAGKPSGRSPRAVWDDVAGLIKALRVIADLEVEGVPSPRTNLDTQVGANHFRLEELLEDSLEPLLKSKEPAAVRLEQAWTKFDDFREVVTLARDYCQVQRDAVLNKLSRGYQKPDFCLRRDAVGAERERLLPRALSWDDFWYYGKDIPVEEVTHGDRGTEPS